MGSFLIILLNPISKGIRTAQRKEVIGINLIILMRLHIQLSPLLVSGVSHGEPVIGPHAPVPLSAAWAEVPAHIGGIFRTVQFTSANNVLFHY